MGNSNQNNNQIHPSFAVFFAFRISPLSPKRDQTAAYVLHVASDYNKENRREGMMPAKKDMKWLKKPHGV